MIFKNKKTRPKRIYLDHASATPIDSAIVASMNRSSHLFFGNPSALYREGVEAKNILEQAREDCAVVIGARKEEIIFTSGGTEGNNLAIRGIIRNYELANDKKIKPHIVTTNIEHSSVLETCRFLEREGVVVTYVGVESNGIVDVKKIQAALRPETVLVSIMYANNEVGTVQPIKEIAKVIRHWKKVSTNTEYPVFHTDACQAANYLNINVVELGVDLMTVNASKIYGPKGIGLIYKKSSVAFSPILYGGGQEQGIRPGTESLSLVVGLTEALKKALTERESESARLVALRDYGMDSMMRQFPTCRINGDRDQRLPNNINISVPNFDSELLVLELDARGFAVSSKSACKTLTPDSSYVIGALGRDQATEGVLRITLGRTTTKSHLDLFLSALKNILDKYQSYSQ